MEESVPQASIPESFLEHRHNFDEPWVDKWILPNPFIMALAKPLREEGVELTDFSFNKDSANVGETYLNIAIPNLNAAVRVGLNNLTFIAPNPAWELAPQFARLFDRVSNLVQVVVRTEPISQDATLALHVTPGTLDFKLSSAALVSPKLSKDAAFCGISVHRGDSTMIIDKSLRYPGAAFVRLQRRFGGESSFSSVAEQLYNDEVYALGLLGLDGVP